jgi:hypothetical protein
MVLKESDKEFGAATTQANKKTKAAQYGSASVRFRLGIKNLR